jgi:DNA-directed RNA polymerase subunit RPC12/RpoP
MATVTDATRRTPRESLIEGRYMRCPRCRKQHDVLLYVPMGLIEEFVAETNPVYKCPSCRWIFSPAAHVVLEDFR